MTEKPLDRLQRDILELESRTWELPGQKISEFRRRHPSVTEMGYYSALLGLLGNPSAYAYAGGRYAAMLRRIDEVHREAIRLRLGLRGSTPHHQPGAQAPSHSLG